MDHGELIRNIVVAGHLHHGKVCGCWREGAVCMCKCMHARCMFGAMCEHIVIVLSVKVLYRRSEVTGVCQCLMVVCLGLNCDLSLFVCVCVFV